MIIYLANYYCNCPGAERGKIIVDISKHEPGCWVRKKLQTGQYTTNTSVTPEDFRDGYALGAAV